MGKMIKLEAAMRKNSKPSEGVWFQNILKETKILLLQLKYLNETNVSFEEADKRLFPEEVTE